MNPKLKKVIIIAVVLMILCFGGIFLSSAISGMSKTTITDFKIVDANNNLMRDQNVFINETSSNKFKLGVVIAADGQDGGYNLYSTNPSVANVVWYEDGYYVEYYNSGQAKIVAQSRVVENLRDSFNVNVYENYFVDVKFTDSAAEDGKTIDIYADNIDYSYKFNLIGMAENLEQNSRMFKVVEISNPTLFNKAEVNSESNTLELSVKSRIDNKVVVSSNEYIVLQSYIRDANGNLVVQDNFIVKVNIICNTVEDIQLEFSDKFDFNTEKTYIFSMLADADYANSLINQEDEVLIRKVYCGEHLPYLYFKVRLVYANRSVTYITKNCIINGLNNAGSTEKQDDDSSMSASDYVNIFNLYSFNQERISFNVQCDSSDLTNYETISTKFVFIILKSNLHISQLYKYDKQNKTYTFSYFDNRLKRFDTITDKNGNIIRFEGEITGIVYDEYDSESGNTDDGFISGYSSYYSTDESV